MILFIVVSPDVFEFFFGQDWRQAGIFARALAIPMSLIFMLMPFTRLFAVLELQNHGLKFHLILLIARASSLMIGIYLGDLILAIYLLSLATTLVWIGFLIWLSKIVQIELINFFKQMVNQALIGIAISLLPVISIYINLSISIIILSTLFSIMILFIYFYYSFKKN